MSNLQLLLAGGLPTITALIGILLSQHSLDRLGQRIDGVDKRMDNVDRRFDRLESRLDRIEADLREFYRTIGQHEVRMDALEKCGAKRRQSMDLGHRRFVGSQKPVSVSRWLAARIA